MKTIKFNPRYLKFRGLKIPKYATILEVFKKDRTRLDKAFVDYGTAFVDDKNQVHYYPLSSEGMQMVLLLRDDEGNLFTTIMEYKRHQPYTRWRGKRVHCKLIGRESIE